MGVPLRIANPWRKGIWLHHGQALLLGAFLSLSVGVLALESAPVTGSFSTSFSSLESNDSALISEALDRWIAENENQKVHCELTRPVKPSSITELNCRFQAANEDAWFDTLNALTGQWRTVQARGSSSFSTKRAFDRIPLWMLLVATFVYFSLSAILVRGTHLKSDLSSAGTALKRAPWLPALPIMVWFIVANLSLVVLGLFGFAPTLGTDPQETAQLEQAILDGIQVLITPFAILNGILLAPVFEEALFRGWLYKKARHIQRRWVVALLNGWFFMLLHILVLAPGVALGLTLNPAQVSPLSVPIWFALGLVLFWVREKYQSITLCIFLHAVYNGTTFAGFYWLQTTLNQ